MHVCACQWARNTHDSTQVDMEPAALHLTIMTLLDAVSNKSGTARCNFAKMPCCDYYAHFNLQKSKSPPNPCLTEVFRYIYIYIYFFFFLCVWFFGLPAHLCTRWSRDHTPASTWTATRWLSLPNRKGAESKLDRHVSKTNFLKY